MPYTARKVPPVRKKHHLSQSAHWAPDQRLPGATSSSRRPMSSASSGGSSYGNLFRNTSMPTDFHSFAEKAIEMAGQAGERKRQFRTQQAGNLARSRMAEINRQQEGATRRQAMIEAGKAAGRGTLGSGLRGAGAKSAGMMPKSTRLKSFDYANKAMGEMYPERINPVTNKPFTPKAWTERINELADQREAYGGIQPTAEQPVGLSGRGRVMRDTGEVYDITPGVAGYSKSMATPEMMESVGFLQEGAPPGEVAPPGESEAITPAETTVPTALETWEKKYPRRKEIRGAKGREDPIKTFMRSLTKPIDRSRLGRQYDYMSRFGSQQGYNR